VTGSREGALPPITLLSSLLGLDEETRVVCFVGAGGKTSLMYALARELVNLGGTVVSTTTTKIYPPQAHESPFLLLAERDPLLSSLAEHLTRFSHVTVADRIDPVSAKLTSVTEEIVAQCARMARWVLVEADGAAGRPVKAPALWEPVIPNCCDLVIPMVGLDCLGKPAGQDFAFRIAEFLAITGLQEGEAITPQAVARLVTHPRGGMKGVRDRMRVTPFLNKMDLVPAAVVKETARAILEAGSGKIRRVAAGTLKGTIQGTAFDSQPPPT